MLLLVEVYQQGMQLVSLSRVVPLRAISASFQKRNHHPTSGLRCQRFVRRGRVVENLPHVTRPNHVCRQGYIAPGSTFEVSNVHTCVGGGGSAQDAMWYIKNQVKFMGSQVCMNIDPDEQLVR